MEAAFVDDTSGNFMDEMDEAQRRYSDTKAHVKRRQAEAESHFGSSNGPMGHQNCIDLIRIRPFPTFCHLSTSLPTHYFILYIYIGNRFDPGNYQNTLLGYTFLREGYDLSFSPN